LLNFFLLIVKKPDVIQKNELYFCNQGSNVIQNQLSKSKHRLKSFVLQACVIIIRKSFNVASSEKKKCINHGGEVPYSLRALQPSARLGL
jgi:hypothetical protein